MLGRNYDGQNCSIARALEVVGERWTLLILREAFLGTRRFDAFHQRLGIARNILQARLERLVEEGILVRRPYQERPPRYEYRMTAKGWDLFPFTIALHDWGSRWIASPHGPGLKLRHRPCDHRLRGKMVCGSCGEAIEPHDVQIRGATRWAARRERHGPKIPRARAKR